MICHGLYFPVKQSGLLDINDLWPIIKSWLWFPNMTVYAKQIDMELQTLQNLASLHMNSSMSNSLFCF